MGYLAKLKRSLGIAFRAHFLHDVSIKCSLFNTLAMDKVSMSHLTSFSRYQTKRVIKFLFRHLINFKVFLRSAFKAMTGKKIIGEDENIKFEYLENEKGFLDFEGLSFGEK